MKLFYFIPVFILLGISCHREQKENSFTIHGEFSHSRGEKIILSEMGVKDVTVLDSAKVGNDGKINFSNELDQPGFYLLMFPSGRRLTLVINKGENLLITGDLMDSTADFIVTGSDESQLLQAFFHATMRNNIRIDSIKRVLLMHEGSDDFLRLSMKADSLFLNISGDQKKLEKEFIDKNPLSLASLIILNYSFGPMPVLTMKDDLPYYQKLTGLLRIYPKNQHVLFHVARVKLFMNNLKNPEQSIP